MLRKKLAEIYFADVAMRGDFGICQLGIGDVFFYIKHRIGELGRKGQILYFYVV